MLHSLTSGRVFPFPWQCTEGHILQPCVSVPLIAGCFCLPQWQLLVVTVCQWQLFKLTLLLFGQVSMQKGGWCPLPAAVPEMKYCKVIALYAAQTGEVHDTALIFSLFHRVTDWLLNPCLTVWIIRRRGINAFNVYTRSKCWLLTRSEKNNEMP